MVKHDIKRKMLEYIYLFENEEYDKLNYILQCQYEELKYLDEEMYSFNPVVNSVLRGCIGKIKGRDIKVETDINIPGDVEFFDKYDGKVKFEQEEDRFVVKGFLNCKNWCQGIA